MRGARRAWFRQRGGSLLEVVIALGIAALSLLGAISSQLVAVRAERSSAQRELASLIAASAADAMRDRSADARALEYWRSQAIRVLPRGDIAVHAGSSGAAFVAVRWALPRVGANERSTHSTGCPREVAVPGFACTVAPFVR